MALHRPDAGFKFCPHCNGKTVCNCATCGIESTTRARGQGARWMEAGMCKACHGQGQVVDPDYRPPVPTSAQSNTGCAFAAFCLLVPALLTLSTIVYAWAR